MKLKNKEDIIKGICKVENCNCKRISRQFCESHKEEFDNKFNKFLEKSKAIEDKSATRRSYIVECYFCKEKFTIRYDRIFDLIIQDQEYVRCDSCRKEWMSKVWQKDENGEFLLNDKISIQYRSGINKSVEKRKSYVEIAKDETHPEYEKAISYINQAKESGSKNIKKANENKKEYFDENSELYNTKEARKKEKN